MNQSESTPTRPSGTLPEIAIILVNWNGRADTLECLESVFRLDYPNYRVVVCDNASSDDSIAAISEWVTSQVTVEPQSPHFSYLFTAPLAKKNIHFASYTIAAAEGLVPQAQDPRLVLIEVGANLGFAGGNNVGIRYALNKMDSKYVWLLNTDTVVPPDALTKLVERAMVDESIGMVGSSLVYYWEPGMVQGMGGARMDHRSTRCEHIGVNQPIGSIPVDPSAVEAKMTYVIGASMLVSRAFIEAVGPMCEDYFLYYEEIDWALRGEKQFRLAYAPASFVFHKVGGSSKSVASMTSLRFLHQNRLKFVARFLPGRYLATMLSLAGDMLRATLKGQLQTSRAIGEALLRARRHFLEEKNYISKKASV